MRLRVVVAVEVGVHAILVNKVGQLQGCANTASVDGQIWHSLLESSAGNCRTEEKRTLPKAPHCPG